MKAIGKRSLIPGLFNVSDPVLYSMPIMCNPLLMFPYIFGTLLLGILTWIGLCMGIYKPQCVLVGSSLPIGLQGMLETMSVSTLFFQLAMALVMVVICYPFFQAYDKQLVQKELDTEIKRTGK